MCLVPRPALPPSNLSQPQEERLIFQRQATLGREVSWEALGPESRTPLSALGPGMCVLGGRCMAPISLADLISPEGAGHTALSVPQMP